MYGRPNCLSALSVVWSVAWGLVLHAIQYIEAGLPRHN